MSFSRPIQPNVTSVDKSAFIDIPGFKFHLPNPERKFRVFVVVECPGMIIFAGNVLMHLNQKTFRDGTI